MQSLKWRLSFNNSKQPKQYIRLWNELYQMKKENEPLKFKSLLILLDLIINSSESKTNMIDEFHLNEPKLFPNLIDIFKHYLNLFSMNRTENIHLSKILSEYDLEGNRVSSLFSDFLEKFILAIEVLLTVKGSKKSLKENLSKEERNATLSCLVEIIEKIEDVNIILSLLRTIKSLLSSHDQLLELINMKGFDLFSNILNRHQDPVIISQILNIYKYAMDQIDIFLANLKSDLMHSPVHLIKGNNFDARNRTYSNSSMGSIRSENFSISNQFNYSNNFIQGSSTSSFQYSQRPYQYPNLGHFNEGKDHSSLNEKNETSSIATKSFNMAYNLFNELIKYTPLSSSWIKSEENDVFKNLGIDKSIFLEEEINFLSSIPLPIDKVFSEIDRIDSLVEHKDALSDYDYNTFDDPRASTPENSEFTIKQLSSMRSSIRHQGMKKVLLEAINLSNCPQEVFESLLSLQTFLSKDKSTSVDFFEGSGQIHLLNMFLRVEDNLPYLQSCSEQSFTAASNGTKRDTNNSKGMNKDFFASQYFSSLGNDFDNYYSNVAVYLLNILFDQVIFHHIYLGDSIPQAQNKNFEIINFEALPLLSSLMNSSRIPLMMVSLTILQHIIRINPINAISLEKYGVISSVVSVFFTISFSLSPDPQSLRNEASPTSETQFFSSSPSFNLNHGLEEKLPNNIINDAESIFQFGMESRQIASDSSISIIRPEYMEMLISLSTRIVEILQSLSVALYYKNDSLFHLLVYFLNMLSTFYLNSVLGEVHMRLRCHNCDVEFANFQCLHYICIRNKCDLLCTECDQVFHKSYSKRCHIRVPVLNNTNIDVAETHSEIQSNKEGLREFCQSSKCVFSCLDLLKKKIDSLYDPVLEQFNPHYIAKISAVYLNKSEPELSYYINFKVKSIIMIQSSIRSLLDDRKARNLPLPLEALPSLLVSFRNICFQRPIKNEIYNNRSSQSDHDLNFYDLVEFREEIFSTKNGLFKKNSLQENIQPPESNHFSLKRVTVQLGIQIFTRYLIAETVKHDFVHELSDDFLSPFTGDMDKIIFNEDILEFSLSLFGSYNIDAFIIHLITDLTQYNQLTLSDKQFFIWVYRECLVSSLKVNQNLSERLIHWTIWALRGDLLGVDPNNQNQKSSSQHSFLNVNPMNEKSSQEKIRKMTNKNNFPNSSKLSYPSVSPVVSIHIRLLIVQELRLLFCSSNHSNHHFTKNASCISSTNKTEVFNLSLALPRESIQYSNPTILPKATLNESQQPKTDIDFNSMRTIGRSSTQSFSDSQLLFSAPLDTHELQLMFARSSIIDTLISILFGNLCSKNIAPLFIEKSSAIVSKKSKSNSNVRSIFISEAEKSEWWSSLSLLQLIVSGCDEAKNVFDEKIGLDNFIKKTLPIVSYLGSSKSSEVLREASIELINLYFEFSLTFDCFSRVQSAFGQAVLKYPFLDQPIIEKLDENEKEVDKDAKIGLLILDQLTSNSFLKYNSPHLKNNGIGNKFSAIRSYSNEYYTNERTVAVISTTMCSYNIVLLGKSIKKIPKPILSRSNSGSATKPINTSSSLKIHSWEASEGRKSFGNIDSASNASGYSSIVRMRNISTASFQSQETDTKWELESTGMTSSYNGDTNQGRNSFHSHQSLAALSQIIDIVTHNRSSPQFSQFNEDFTSRLSLNASEVGSINNDILHSASANESNLAEYDSGKKGKNTVQQDFNLYFDSEIFPFPEFLSFRDVRVPNVYSPLLRLTSNKFNINHSLHLLLLYHYLVSRSWISLSSKNVDNSFPSEQKTDIKQNKYSNLPINLDSSILLKKNLMLFINLTNNSDSFSNILWRPSYSRLKFRSIASIDSLLSLAMILKGELQNHIFSIIANLIQGNPANAFKFVTFPSVNYGLLRLLPYSNSNLQESLGRIVSQSLNYSIDGKLFSEIMYWSILSSNSNDLKIFDSNDKRDIFIRNILFLMGRTSERTGPSSYLHFDLSHPFESSVELFPSENSNSGEPGLSLCTWVQLGGLKDFPVSSFCQLNSHDKKFSVNIFFRVVLKYFDDDSEFFLKEDSMDLIEALENIEINPRRYLQLCISFVDQNSINEPAELTTDSHWQEVMRNILDPTGYYTLGNLEKDLVMEFSNLSYYLSKYSLPDAIIEFNWSEYSDWHLLYLNISNDDISCRIDGMKRSVLYWTPYGYKSKSTVNLNSKSFSVYSQKPSYTQAQQNQFNFNLSPISGQTSLISKFLTNESILSAAQNNTNLNNTQSHSAGQSSGLFRIALGGAMAENIFYTAISSNISIIKTKSNENFPNRSTILLKLENLLQLFDNTISGFSGNIGEICFYDIDLDSSLVDMCFHEGPNFGLRYLNQYKPIAVLSSSLLGAISNQIYNKQIDSSEKSSSISFPSFLLSSSNQLINKDSDIEVLDNLYGKPLPPKEDLALKSKQLKDLISNIKLNKVIQIHNITNLADTLPNIGGSKLFFPFMTKDKIRLIAALRIIGNLINSSQDFYNEFKTYSIDKVILAACYQQPEFVTLETLEVLFDVIIKKTTEVSSANSTSILESNMFLNAYEKLNRPIILDLLLDLVVSLRDVYLARSVINWLTEVCDEDIENCQFFLRSNRLIPTLLLISLWNINGSFFEEKKSIVASKEVADKGTRPQSNNLDKIDISSLQLPQDSLTAESNLGPFKDSIGQQMNLGERYKLQYFCFKFLRLLVCGTTGEMRPISSTNSLGQSLTNFDTSHMSFLLEFVLSSTRSVDSFGIMPEKSKKADFKEKKIIYSSFKGLPLLKNIPLSSTQYWNYSAGLAIMDMILDLSLGPLESVLISLLKASFQGNSVGNICLELMTCECIEIRERSISLLILWLSATDGKPDSKLIQTFEKAHGFELMAENLSIHSSACTENILNKLLEILYWDRKFSKRNSNKKLMSRSAAVSPVNLNKPNNDPASKSLNKNNEFVTVLSDKINLEKDQKHSDNKSIDIDINHHCLSDSDPQSQGTLNSFFNRNQSMPINQIASQDDIEFNSPNNNISYKRVKSNNSITSERVLEAHSKSPVLFFRSSSNNSQAAVNYIDNEFHPQKRIVEDENDYQAPQSIPNVFVVPQMLEVIFRILKYSKSVELVQSVFRKLEESISHFKSPHTEKFMSVSNSDNKVTISPSTSLTGTTAKLKSPATQSDGSKSIDPSKNIELLFSQKDWLIKICDLLTTFRREFLNTDELDFNNSYLSQSDNDSYNYMGYSSNDASATETESNRSFDEDIFSDGCEEFIHHHNNSTAKRSSGGSSIGGSTLFGGPGQSWQKHLVSQFTNPIFGFVRKLLLLDLKEKPSSSRRYHELFRLSLPETNDVLEAILLDLLSFFHSNVIFSHGTESSMNILKNLGNLLEQSLDKIDLTIPFCVKTIKALHYLSYQCPPEIRSRIKETNLTELRKQFIARCVMDTQQDVYMKLFTLVEISLPLQGYLSSIQHKILADSQVLVILFGVFFESLDEFEFIISATSDSDLFQNYINSIDYANVDTDNQENSTLQKVHISFELLKSSIILIQNCVHSSNICKKDAIKMMKDLPGDSDNVILKNFTGMSTEMNTIEPEANLEANQTISTSDQIEISSSYSWFSTWMMPNSSESIDTKASPPSSSSLLNENFDPTPDKSRDTSSSSDMIFEGLSLKNAKQEEKVDLKSFIAWIMAPTQRELLSAFKSKIMKDIKIVFRGIDKLREKSSYKVMKNQRYLQEKRAKENSLASRNLKEGKNFVKQSNDKIYSMISRDIATYCKSLKDKLDSGKASLSISFDEKPTMLPSSSKAFKEFLSQNSMPTGIVEIIKRNQENDPILPNLVAIENDFSEIHEFFRSFRLNS